MTDYSDDAFMKGVKMLIRSNFKNWKDFWILPEYKVYNDQDVGIWAQMTGRAPRIIEIRLNDKYLCDINESMRPAQALKEIEQAFISKVTLEKNGKSYN